MTDHVRAFRMKAYFGNAVHPWVRALRRLMGPPEGLDDRRDTPYFKALVDATEAQARRAMRLADPDR